MSLLTRATLSVLALAAMLSAAQAQTADQDHQAHHPDGQAAPQAQATPTPPSAARPVAPGGAPMMGQGMGSGAMVQPGGQTGMPMGMDQMMPMMRQMMGQQDGQSGMMGDMGQIMPMMRQMMGPQGGQPGMAMGMPFEHVEGRIAFLKAELEIIDAQLPTWNAFADALRSSAKVHRTAHERMTQGGVPSTWTDRLSVHLGILSARVDALKTLEAAAEPLYAALTDEQRKLADRLLSGPMGMM